MLKLQWTGEWRWLRELVRATVDEWLVVAGVFGAGTNGDATKGRCVTIHSQLKGATVMAI